MQYLRKVWELLLQAKKAVARKIPAVPDPFLGPLFGDYGVVKLGSCWNYDAAETGAHGIELHEAIDLDAPRGTEVLAPCGGWAVATWQEAPIVGSDDKQRLWQGRPVWFGTGLTVQVWVPGVGYVQLGHLQSVIPAIPFYKPTQDKAGNLLPQNLRVPVSQYGRQVKAYRVKAGEVIGMVGVTGCGLGARTYDTWCECEQYSHYDVPHVHLVVFRRTRKLRKAVRWDPFGIYGKRDRYPADPREWHKHRRGQKHHGLWLPQV